MKHLINIAKLSSINLNNKTSVALLLLVFGVSVLEGNYISFFHLFGILLSFLIGSAITGIYLDQNHFVVCPQYRFILLLETLMIFTSLYLVTHNHFSGHYAASAACG